MNFDFTPPKTDFTAAEQAPVEETPQETPVAPPVAPPVTPPVAPPVTPPVEAPDWIAAALPPQNPPQNLFSQAPQTASWAPIPDPVALPVAPYQAPAPEGDGTGGLIPYKNPMALLGYYVAVFGLIPCVGLILGPTAIIMGIMGLKFNKANPHTKGVAHAWVAIVLGSIELIAHIALIGVSVIGASR